MNLALNAVRYANPGAFSDTPKMASKTAKRALLRHLADMSRWSCELHAYLADRPAPKCEHRSCEWLCFQSEPETAEELSMSESAVKRTRRALILDGWVQVTQENTGRASRTFYTLNRVKLLSVTKQKHEKRCRMPASLIPPAPSPVVPKEEPPTLFAESSSPRPASRGKEGNLPPIPKNPKEEGGQCAQTRGAMCSKKGGNVPSLNRKNRNEPSSEPKAIPRPPTSPAEFDLERLYQAYPKHVGKPEAIKAIRTAVRELGSGKERPICSVPEALEFLLQKTTAFAASPAGRSGKFTPHPATWFNQGRYHDDEREWHAADQGPSAPNRGQARQDSALDALRRANEADANSSAARDSRTGAEGSHGRRGIAALLSGS